MLVTRTPTVTDTSRDAQKVPIELLSVAQALGETHLLEP